MILLKSILFFLLFTNCKNEVQKLERKKRPERNEIIKKIEIINNTDEDFNTFLLEFNKDSIFQISRIDFPLKVTEPNEEIDFETIEKLISKKDYRKLDFTYPKDALTREFDKFTQKTKFHKNNATIEIRGVDNGINSDIVFEKLNGKWYLKTWVDSST